jgi:hypothetical protein
MLTHLPRSPAPFALRALLAQANLTADVLRRAGEWAAAAECEVMAEVVGRRLARLSRPVQIRQAPRPTTRSLVA